MNVTMQTVDQTILSHRTNVKDEFNKMYAATLRKSFQDLPHELRIEFNLFTHNLMDEEYISKNLLLDVTNSFYTYFNHLCDATSIWRSFMDNALNTGGAPNPIYNMRSTNSGTPI